jgi:hypothetical protein
MEGMVFWLVPVLLVVVFTLILLHHAQSGRKPRLLLVEPCGTLVRQWHLARIIGDERQVIRLLGLTQAYHDHSGSILEQVLHSVSLNGPKPSSTLLRLERLPVMGEKRALEVDGKVMLIAVGLIEEVLPLVKYDSDGKTLLGDESGRELQRVSTNAAAHGYLPLACVGRFAHGKVPLTGAEHFSWAGLALLEPEVDREALSKLQSYPRAKLKLLSVLPDELLGQLSRQVGRSEAWAGLGAGYRDNPQEQEQYWDATAYIGAAGLRERYSAIRYFQHGRDCQVWSANPEDAKLPAPVTRQL